MNGDKTGDAKPRSRTYASFIAAAAATDDEGKAAFLRLMGELYISDRAAYRGMRGMLRALYLKSNPKPPKAALALALHERARSRVRPIDFNRAERLPAVLAELKKQPTRRAA